jgi:CheY-like chemotaxis protein
LSARVHGSGARPFRVLAVGPGVAVRLVLGETLAAVMLERGRELSFTAASDAVEALWLFSRASYDVVFFTLDLAPMSGLDLGRLLRARPEPRRAALVALSTTETPETAKRVRDAGGDALLLVPFDRQAIESVLAALPASGPEAAR